MRKLADKIFNYEHMNDEEKAELLSENGMLIRRPLLIDQDNVLIGFKQAEWDSYFSEM